MQAAFQLTSIKNVNYPSENELFSTLNVKRLEKLIPLCRNYLLNFPLSLKLLWLSQRQSNESFSFAIIFWISFAFLFSTQERKSKNFTMGFQKVFSLNFIFNLFIKQKCATKALKRKKFFIVFQEKKNHSAQFYCLLFALLFCK